MFGRHYQRTGTHGDADQPLIRLRGLRKSYYSAAGESPVLRGIDLDIQCGEFISVVGKSGSGKTTLINMIAGIDRPSGGEVWIGGTAVHGLREGRMAAWRGRNIGIVFQFFQLLPTLSLLDNVMLPMDLVDSCPARERQDRAMHLLGLVGIADQADKLPAAVSGGQQQRAAVARALANDPPLIVADEPTGNLDQKTAAAVFGLFEKLAAQGKTIIIVSHDADLARRVHRSVIISDGEIYNGEVARAVLSRPSLAPAAVR